MNKGAALLGGLGLGAGLMYLLDPVSGRRRRALLRDQATRTLNHTSDFLDAAARDLRNRAVGVAAEARGALRRDPVPDEVLAERVRARIGRVVSHPRAVHVACKEGTVTLEGHVLSAELDPLIDCVQSTHGVVQVINQLEAHSTAEGVPDLQGGHTRTGLQPEFLQEHWAPGPRLLACLAGGALAAYGARRGGLGGTAATAIGAALCARAIANEDFATLAGTNGHNGLEIQKTLTIHAPVDKVFELWSNFTQFPYYLAHVRDVEEVAPGRSRWTVAGPAGKTVQFEAEVTNLVPNEEISWTTVDGSPVHHHGTVQFTPTAEGFTRVHVRMTYCPPAGMAAHGLARLLGHDPKAILDSDLARLKTYLETGHVAHDAARRPAAVAA